MRFRLLFAAFSLVLCASAALQAAQATRKYGEVAAPSYGEVPAPRYGNVPAPTYGETELPRSNEPTWPAETPPNAGERPAQSSSPAPPAGPVAGAISASYYFTDRNGVLHTWDFAANGTYLYTQVTKGAGFSGRSSERGTYQITGLVLEVHPSRQTGATASGTSGGKTDILTAGSDEVRETRRYRIELLGPDGREGAILDGVRMKTKSW